MADYGNNPGSFDVDKELEALMKDLHMSKQTHAPQPAQRPQAPQQPRRMPVATNLF